RQSLVLPDGRGGRESRAGGLRRTCGRFPGPGGITPYFLRPSWLLISAALVASGMLIREMMTLPIGTRTPQVWNSAIIARADAIADGSRSITIATRSALHSTSRFTSVAADGRSMITRSDVRIAASVIART